MTTSQIGFDSSTQIPYSSEAKQTRPNGESGMGPGTAGITRYLRGYWTEAGRVAALNFLSLMAAAFVGQICGLATVVLLTKHLGAERFGVYMSAVSLQFYLVPLGSGGLATLLVRELARRPDASSRLIAAYFTLTLVLSPLIAAGLGIVAWGWGVDGDEFWLIVCVGIGNVGTSVSAAPLLDLHHRQRIAAMLGGVIEVLALLVLLSLVAGGQLTLATAGALLAAKYLALSLMQIGAARWGGILICGQFGWTDVVQLARGAPSMVLASLVATIPVTSGTFWVREYHGNAAAGVMGLGVIFLNLIGLFAIQMQRILMPHMVRTNGTDPAFIRRLVLAYVGFLVVLGVGAWGGVWGFTCWFLTPEYEPLVPLATWLIAGGFGLAASWLATGYLVVLGRENRVLEAQIASAIVFLFCAWRLTPPLAGMGIAWSIAAAAVTLSSVASFRLFQVWKERISECTRQQGTPVHLTKVRL